jgi:hypothetical protein
MPVKYSAAYTVIFSGGIKAGRSSMAARIRPVDLPFLLRKL